MRKGVYIWGLKKHVCNLSTGVLGYIDVFGHVKMKDCVQNFNPSRIAVLKRTCVRKHIDSNKWKC